jgi:hypothetical protein
MLCAMCNVGVEDGQNKNRRQAHAIGAYLLLDRN